MPPITGAPAANMIVQRKEEKPACARQTSKLAILVSPTDVVSPSSYASLHHFITAAERCGVEAALIASDDPECLTGFDALFVRQTTSPGGKAHRFSQHARGLGMPVLDDPLSIERGSNKIIQCQLLAEGGITLPRTRIISSPTSVADAASVLGLPVVLKIPDGCYCRGVEKAGTTVEAAHIAEKMLAFNTQILVQEYVPTHYDWRVCILGGAPLFACKYHMVHGHWQVIARGTKGSLNNGDVEPVALHHVPCGIIDLAVQAARCIGHGLYGVDIKETSQGPVVIEVNDNPDMDHDVETTANPEAWDRLAAWFAAAHMCRRVTCRPAVERAA